MSIPKSQSNTWYYSNDPLNSDSLIFKTMSQPKGNAITFKDGEYYETKKVTAINNSILSVNELFWFISTQVGEATRNQLSVV
jgi:hypothetical protein